MKKKKLNNRLHKMTGCGKNNKIVKCDQNEKVIFLFVNY
jgi:hypothetical protein